MAYDYDDDDLPDRFVTGGEAPPRPGATQTHNGRPGHSPQLYGYVRRTGDDSESDQIWEPTYNPEDMLKPADQFIVCDSKAEAEKILMELYPVPAETSGVRFRQVYQTGGYGSMELRVAPRPNVHVDGWYAQQRPDEMLTVLADAAQAKGGLALSNRDDADCIRKLDGYQNVDLVVSDTDAGLVLRYDPKRAAVRRKAAAGKIKAAAEKYAAASKVNAEQDKALRPRNNVEDLVRILWKNVPLLETTGRVCKAEYSTHPFEFLKQFITLHEKLVGRHKWRASDAVDKFLTVVFDDWELITKERTYYTYGDECSAETLAWLYAEACRHHRAVARKRKKEERAGSPPTPPPVVPDLFEDDD